MRKFFYKNDRFSLKFFDKTDIFGNYQNWWYDEEVTRYNSHGLFPYTEKKQKDFLKQINCENYIVCAVYANDKKKHIGNISLNNINWINRSAEFACVFGEKDYWGKGFGTQSASILFSHGFNKLNLNRIWTGTAVNNIGMQKIALKLGMKKEGIFKNAVFLNGEFVDVFMYGILREQFKYK